MTEIVYVSVPPVTHVALPIIGGALVIGIGGGIVVGIGIAIWSKILSWEQRKNAQKRPEAL